MTALGRRLRRSREDPNGFSQELFAPLAPRYDAMATLLSFGQDPRWRSTMVRRVAGVEPRLVLDVACGTGAVIGKLTTSTDAHVVGVDLSEPMLGRARRRFSRNARGSRVHLVRARAERLPFADATFDAVTFTYLLRYVEDPAATLRELARVLRPGGAISSVEFAVPSRRVWWLAWWMYTRTFLPLAGYLLGGTAWWTVGRFLGPSISRHYRRFSRDWTRAEWGRAGIEHVEVRTMSLGGGVVFSGYRRG